jgi:nucleotidyltransferase/DNA polymerase involved in DNA repair
LVNDAMQIVCYHLPDFGLACERKRLPELRTQPLALTTSEGLIRAASAEAAEKGVRPGMAAAAARIFCEELILRPYDLPFYTEMAEAVWNRIALDSSFVEPVSPEVCFAVFSGPGIMERLHTSVRDLHLIAETTVHTGMARSRFTAQVAASCDSGDSPVVVPSGGEMDFLAACPLRTIAHFKMGGSASRTILNEVEMERLDRLGVRTLGDVLAVDERDLHRLFREKGFLLRRLAQGLDREPVHALWPPKIIEHALRLDEGIADEMMMEAAMRICAEKISGALKQEGRQCRRLTLLLRREDGRFGSSTEMLRRPEDQASSIFRAARRLYSQHIAEVQSDAPLDDIRFVEVAIRASAIGLYSGVQPALLDDNEFLRGLPHERQERLDAAIHQVCRRFGADRVAPASRSLSRPRPFQLWTYPLTRRLDETIEVITDPQGNPVRYARRGQWWDVRHIQNRWSEAEWRTGRVEERMVFRVEAAPDGRSRYRAYQPPPRSMRMSVQDSVAVPVGLSELQRCGDQWRLTAIAD